MKKKDKWDIQPYMVSTILEQNREGLLYDLNLLPEVVNTSIDYFRYQAIIILQDTIKKQQEIIDDYSKRGRD